jgi:hypothetical protein
MGARYNRFAGKKGESSMPPDPGATQPSDAALAELHARLYKIAHMTLGDPGAIL